MTALEAISLAREIKSLDEISAAQLLLQVELKAWKQGSKVIQEIYKPVKEEYEEN